MKRIGIAILFALPLSVWLACGDAADTSLAPGDGSGTGGDGGSSDAGSTPDKDGGADAGNPTLNCTLTAYDPKLTIGASAETQTLYALEATADRVAIARGTTTGAGTVRKLRFIDRKNGFATSDTALTALGAAIPVELDHDGTSYVLAANNEADPARPTTFLGYVSDLGVFGNSTTRADRITLSAARETGGARVLVQEKSGATLGQVVADRYDETPAFLDTVTVAPGRRPLNRWHLVGDGQGGSIACGYTTVAGADYLTLFDLKGTTVTQLQTSHRLAADPAAGSSSFGCLLAMGPDFRAVALSESDGSPRLAWVDATGAVTHGPAPFMPVGYVNARNFDVATLGGATAVAFADKASGATRLTVRIYPSPGGAPVNLNADDGAALGAFTSGRIRLAAVSSDTLAVVFEAGVSTTRTDLVYREIRCTP